LVPERREPACSLNRINWSLKGVNLLPVLFIIIGHRKAQIHFNPLLLIGIRKAQTVKEKHPEDALFFNSIQRHKINFKPLSSFRYIICRQWKNNGSLVKISSPGIEFIVTHSLDSKRKSTAIIDCASRLKSSVQTLLS